VLRYILRRLIFSVPVLLIASFVVFFVIRSTYSPTSIIALNPRVSQKAALEFRHNLGLDKSVWEQYWIWLKGFATFHWGNSLLSNRPVWPDIRQALANSAILGGVGIALSLVFGVGIGMLSALRQYSFFDYAATSGAFLGLSIPTFWFALMVQLFFGVYITRWFHLSQPIFYTTGMALPGTEGFDVMDRLRHLALPVLVLAVQIVAVYSRYMRASLLEVLQSDYMRTARAKGLRERIVITRHAMRNAMIPITTQLAIDIGLIAGGLIVTETIFGWPGMGRLFIQSAEIGDYQIILPWMMITVMFVILFNLIADIMYAVLDPRIRYA
jgi:peptide/nickel transport system permease protein